MLYLTIAAKLVEAVGPERNGDERDVGVVHGLELDPGVGAVPRGLF